MASQQGLKELIQERLTLPDPPSVHNLKQLAMVQRYLLQGVPFSLDESKLTLEHGKNHFEDKQDQALCLDSLAGAAKKGFIAGPLPLGSIEAPKIVGIFTREQESSQKKRCISDLSQPRSGGSFNDAQSTKPVTDWPMVNPGSIQAAVALILDNHPAWAAKADVSDAYKAIPVQIEQRKYQVYKIGKALFMELCLCFGDDTAAHIFTATHRAVIENFVFPFIPGPLRHLVLVIDDSIFISRNKKWVEAYNTRYREVMLKLNLEVKPHDPGLRKTFFPSQEGEILGYWVNMKNLTWSIALNKVQDILRQVDKILNPADHTKQYPVTLRTLQRVEGKLADLAKLSSHIRIRLMMISHELARAVSRWPCENDLPESRQTSRKWLSDRAAQDLLYLRAIIAQLPSHHLPLQDPRRPKPLSAGLIIFCDASGILTSTAYCGVLITRGPLHPHELALAYEIPNAFLTTQDEKNFNCYNTILLELLSVLATVLEFGPLLRHRKVLFITDCLALVAIFHNRRVPNGKNAAYALQALLEAAEEWHITLKVSTNPCFPLHTS